MTKGLVKNTLLKIHQNHYSTAKRTILPSRKTKPKSISEYSDTQMYLRVDVKNTQHLKDKIKCIKKNFNFKSRFNLIKEINTLIAWLQHEIIANESPNLLDEIKIYEEIKCALHDIKKSKLLLEETLKPSLMNARGKLLNELTNQLPTQRDIDKLKAKHPIFKKIIKMPVTQHVSPLHSIENAINSINISDLDRSISACKALIESNNNAVKKIRTKTGKNNLGGKPNHVGIEEALPILIDIYLNGTGKKPTITWSNYHKTSQEIKGQYTSNFHHFIIELNEILMYIHPNFSLGKKSNIGKIVKNKLAKLRNKKNSVNTARKRGRDGIRK